MNYEVEDRWVEVIRDQYEAALAAKNELWIECGGGECPVKEGALIDVRYRDSDDYPDALGVQALSGIGAGSAYLERDGYSNDIIAYRLHKPTKSEQVRADAWNAYAGITEADDETDLNECIGQGVAPVWNGEGLPTVGCECEFMKHTPDAIPNWHRGIIKYVSEYTVVIVEALSPGEFVAHPRTCDFRPIRTEAERKRDAAVDAFNCLSPIELSGELAYDAIAAGKIPGVKLEG